ncbi:LysO family transporter [uncultured Muribaculum sp.]|uniref:LysO family transporter n=2 Tax=uncultured Muribaculum sp. TaxID=1918613 RepID=UPI00261F5C02|nr:LysO family transporter [uncultured Muribaculum sp.]
MALLSTYQYLCPDKYLKVMNALFILIVSIFIGILFRNKDSFKPSGKIAGATVLLLLFVFGISIGANSYIIENISALGIQSLLLAMAGIAGSVTAVVIIRLKFKRDKQ